MRKTNRRLKHASVGGALPEAMERRLLMSTYTVNTLSDAASPVAGMLTLRQAVADANANPGADTIAFDTGVFTSGGLHTITLVNGPIVFSDTTGATAVNGPGAAVLSISGNQASQVMQVSAGATVSISGLVVTDGAETSPAGADATGGGIQNAGVLTLSGVTVSNSTATGGNTVAGGNDDSSGGIIGGTAYGAGIYSTGALSLINSSVSGNNASGGSSEYDYGGNASGGGIYSTGSLTVTGSSIFGNNVIGGAGGNISGNGDYGGGSAQGGGIFSSGQMVLSSSAVSNNATTGGAAFGGGEADGGGIYLSAAATFSGDTLSGNQASGGSDPSAEGGSGGDAWGGAVYSVASISISSSTLSGNTATGGAGTMQDYGPAGNAYGGAISALDSLTISSSTVSTNAADGGATGSGTNYVTTAAKASGGGIYAAGQLAVTDCTVSMNSAQGSGGGSVDADGGGPGYGGGIATMGTGTISETEITDNLASGGVGTSEADYSPTPAYQSGDGKGGGIYNSGVLSIDSSTINGNRSVGGAGAEVTDLAQNVKNGVGGDALGGGIFSSNTLTVQESTLTGDKATGGLGPDGSYDDEDAGSGGNGEGGAIYCVPALTMSGSTVVQNTVAAGGGGVGLSVSGYTGSNGTPGVAEGGGVYAGNNSVLDNSIVSANNGASGADVYSALSVTSGYNLIGYGGGLTNGVNGNKIGVHDPLLSALANNGGSTQTMLPVAGSPVIDAGSNSLIPSGVTTDQRGDSRISNGTVDIGAVEVQQSKTVAPTPVILLTAATSQTATAGTSSAISLGSFTQSNATGPFTVTINWGDGSASGSVSMAAAGTIPSQTHEFNSAGAKAVSVSVADAEGDESNSESFTVTVAAATSSPTAPDVPASAGTLTLTASTVITTNGTEAKLVATVGGDAGVVPTGTVTFSMNGSVLGSQTLQAGSASFDTAVIPAGSYQYTFTYGGDAHYLTGSSSPESVVVASPSLIASTFIRPVVKPAVIAGTPFNARLPLVLTNAGATVKGDFTIRYYANTTNAIDGGQVLLTTLTRKLALRNGQRAAITGIIRSLPASLPGGSYYLLAEITDPSGLASVATTSTAVTVAAPFVKLSATVGAVTPAVVTTRKPGLLSVTITNSGNIAASGLLTLIVNPSSDGKTALPAVLASLKVKMSIAAGRSRTIRLRVKVPATLAAGGYFPFVSISLGGNSLTAVGSTIFEVG